MINIMMMILPESGYLFASVRKVLYPSYQLNYLNLNKFVQGGVSVE